MLEVFKMKFTLFYKTFACVREELSHVMFTLQGRNLVNFSHFI